MSHAAILLDARLSCVTAEKNLRSFRYCTPCLPRQPHAHMMHYILTVRDIIDAGTDIQEIDYIHPRL